MSNLRHLLNSLIGIRKGAKSDSYFITVISLAGSVFVFFLSVFHIINNLKPWLAYISASSLVFLLLIYYLVRFTRQQLLAKLLLSVIGLILLDIVWYNRYLSTGPVLFFIFAFGALLIWIWEKKWLAAMLVFYFVNLTVLFYIEYTNGGITDNYPSLQRRTIDIYVSFALYSVLMICILWLVKKDFNTQKRKAIKSDKLKSAFLANMSHEIRTPINAIVGFSDLLENEGENPNNKLYIDIIKSSSDNLVKLIEEIIDLSKIEAGYFKLEYSNFNLTKLFSEVKNTSEIELKKRGKSDISLTIKTPENDVLIYSDELRILQVLSNLVNNAIKFTQSGSINFSYEVKNDNIVFCVSDTGIGISDEDQKKIFERFTKFNYKNLNVEGSGIGLSIVEKIIEIFNGKIWLKSKPGVGSEFYFSIPYIKPVEEKTITEVNDVIEKNKQNYGSHKVLIVEDEKYSAKLLSEILNPFNFNIDTVNNGEKAVKYVSENPDTFIVFMDIKLPILNGIKATKKIRKFNNEVIIIAQTAGVFENDEEKALKAGCNNFITKPLDSQKIKKIVSYYIKKKSGHKPVANHTN